jgi:ubiquinol-cytochrome c reductase cytochrome c1 subunit
MRTAFLLLLLAPLSVFSASTSYRLDRSPHDPRDLVSLQAGARTYVNYCLGCHGVQFMRYQSLTDLGLTEQQVKENLMFGAEKLAEPMKVAIDPKESKAWFGVAPPDLSVVARVRGPDWLYTYLRTFYRDPKSTSGWNNAVYANVAMPHALWSLQGVRAMEMVPVKQPDGHERIEHRWSELVKGSQSLTEYDATVRDLVNFLVYVGEPAAADRKSIGIIALFALSLIFVFAYLLKKAFWKDVK